MIEVIEVRTWRDRQAFIDLPYRLYRHDPFYVPPLRSQIKDLMDSRKNIQLQRGPWTLLLCRRNGRAAGRIMVGVDETYNQVNNSRSAWISLFECEQNNTTAETLFQAAIEWARLQGAEALRGPESPDGSDSYRGLLVMGFDGAPAMLNNYNPPWYDELFTRAGFVKSLDLYGYFFTTAQILAAKKDQVIRYAMHRYGYHVDSLDLRQLGRDLADIHEVLVRTIPLFEGEHMAPPTLLDVERMAAGMLPIVDPDLVCIARTDEGNRPIGLVVALPDYNQVFRHIRNGRLLPTGLVKLMYYRRKINATRVFMQFVVQEYHGKAVNNAIFYTMCQKAIAKGYITGDGSAIGETNRQSRASVERMGGVHYRTYRTYRISFGDLKIGGQGNAHG